VNKLKHKPKIKKNQDQVVQVKQNILSKLPKTLEATAKTTGAIIRKRAIKCAADLILIIFLYALTDISQRILAAVAGSIGIADISDQAWQKKRFNVKLGWVLY